MTRQEIVLEFLKKQPNRTFTYDEIAEELGITRRQAGNTIQRMKKWGDVHVHSGTRTFVRYAGD